MIKKLLALLFLFAFLVISCKGDPEAEVEDPESVPVEAEDPAQEDPEAGNPESGMMQEDLSDLIAEAEAALVSASEVGAGDFFPEAFIQASNDLEEATSLAETDTEAAKEMLLAIIDSGDTLYRDSLELLAQKYRDALQKQENKLQELEAPLFQPGAYQKTVTMREELETLLANEELALAYEEYRKTYESMDRLANALANDIAWIKILIRDTETYMADAEEAEAFIYAEEEMNLANRYYLEGTEYFKDYNLADAESQLMLAKYFARKAAYTGNYNRRVSETDSLMMEVMGDIEKASRLTVVDEEGNIVNPEPWDGEKVLEDTPLTDLKPEEEVEEEEEAQSNLQSDKVPLEEEDNAMGDMEEEDGDYLETAKELWNRGLQARNGGDLELAEQYFLQAKIFVEAYESNAVTQVYTVEWREVDTDCLWRIAGYDSIYDNPFLWPKIWRRNKKIIQNPDLIYPGQILVIPPM